MENYYAMEVFALDDLVRMKQDALFDKNREVAAMENDLRFAQRALYAKLKKTVAPA